MIREAPYLVWAALVVLLDQLSKILAVEHLVHQQALPVIPGLNLTLMRNAGAAFSFLAGAGGWQRWFFSGLAVTVSVYLVHLLRTAPTGARAYRFGLALILGGALGNLVDRLRLGHVVDFIEVYYRAWSWPAFNLADSAITAGALLFLWGTTRLQAPEEAAKRAARRL